MKHTAARRHPPGRDLSDTHGLLRRILASAATILASRRPAVRKADDDAAFEVTVLFSLLGLLLFLGMALITDSEATRHGLLHLG